MVPKAISHSRNERGGIRFRVTGRHCATPSFLGINRAQKRARRGPAGVLFCTGVHRLSHGDGQNYIDGSNEKD